MILATFKQRYGALIERLVTALASPRHSRCALIGVLTAYSAVWLAYAVIAKSTQSIHPDMAEVVAWGWDLQWGTPKHPPLLPALVRLWFSVFPLSDWAYYLLATTLSAVAIYFSWLLSGFWLRGTKRAAVPFLLMLIPFYNFLAAKLDHNFILIPLWAITTYAFVKSYETRSICWALCTGICAGLAVLAKYWSFFLLLGLASAALADTQRIRYLKSSTPWIITAVSFGIFLPHLLWLKDNQYPTFHYAIVRAATSWADLAAGFIGYFWSVVAYVTVPILLLLLLTSPSRAAIRDVLLPRDRGRRFAAAMFWVPLLAAIPFSVVTGTRLSGLWMMSDLSLLGVIFLSSPLIRLPRKSVAVIATVATVLSFVALLASPLVALGKLWGGVENYAAFSQLLAADVQKQWDEATTKPLRLVYSVYPLANSVTFYLKNRVLPVPFFAISPTRWANTDTLDRFGAAFICPEPNAGVWGNCRAAVEFAEAGRVVARHVEVKIQPRWLGFAGEPRSFAIDIVLPQSRMLSDDVCCLSAAKWTSPTRP